MRSGAVVVSGIVGLFALFVVAIVALALDLSLGQATGQALPLTCAAAIVAGFLVATERRQA